MNDPKTILIVDDEAAFREIIGTQLKALGFQIATASNGQEAVAQAEKLQPDLILMDIHLGEKETGTDVALSLKQNAKTRGLKIAFLSSLKEPWPGVAGENPQVAKEIGMEDYLTKTDDPQVIGEKVKQLLASTEIAPRAEASLPNQPVEVASDPTPPAIVPSTTSPEATPRPSS